MEYEVSRFGAFLATRETGAKLREDLERQLRNATDQEALVVSFSGVEAVTISFADEFVGRLIAARESGDTPDVAIVFVGMNPEVQEALDICLERRKAVALSLQGKKLSLLGGEEFLGETLDAARKLRSFRAIKLAEALEITPQNANNRLKRLASAGVLVRKRTAPEGGGKEFVYELPRI
jgi:STAS-like domain of unknown function (DUF4325)